MGGGAPRRWSRRCPEPPLGGGALGSPPMLARADRGERATESPQHAAAPGPRRRDAGGRGPGQGRDPRHDGGANAARPRRGRLVRPARARVQRGRVPPPLEPDLPRGPSRAIPEAPGDGEREARYREPPEERRDADVQRARARVPLRPRRPRSATTTGQPPPDHGELDATWPEQRLVVEVDGWAGHGTRRAFESDRARDRELVVAGWRVIRLTWRQLDEDGETIARQLSALLGATRARRSARRARRPPPATRARRAAAP